MKLHEMFESVFKNYAALGDAFGHEASARSSIDSVCVAHFHLNSPGWQVSHFNLIAISFSRRINRATDG